MSPSSRSTRLTARVCAASTVVVGTLTLSLVASAASATPAPRQATPPVGGVSTPFAPAVPRPVLHARTTVLAADSFERTSATGLGTADSGGAWTVAARASSVSGGRARLPLDGAAASADARLSAVSSTGTDVQVSVSLDKLQAGGPAYVSLSGRRVAGAGDYRVKLRYGTDRTVAAYLVRTDASGVETTLSTIGVAGLTATAGDALRVRLKVTGTAPTSISAKVWRVGSAEPGAWLLETSDASPALQGPGALGLLAYVSGQSTTGGQTLTLDDLVAARVEPPDVVAPDTVLTGGPVQGSVQTTSSATVSFTSTEDGSTFQCRLDAAAYAPCAGSVTYASLARAPHTVEVRATDAAGNVDATPASRSFTVTAPAPAGGKPTAASTGVPDGTVLTPYYGDLRITTPGATYDSLDIHGFVTVLAPDVTITRSIVRGGRATGNLGLITNTSTYATNFTVSDSELVPEYPSVWLDGIKGFNFNAKRIDAHGTVDLAKVYGPNVSIVDSWLHDTQYYSSDPNQNGGPTHNDGVQVLGGSNIHITGNLIYGGSNAALQVTQTTGSVNAEFSGNWVDGGNCTINVQNQPLPTLTGMTIRNNRFGHNTRYVDCAVISQPLVTLQVSGNVWDDTGLPARLRLNG